MTGFPDRFYHATRRASLDSILQTGLLTARFGEIHGAMEYRPAGPSVYISRHPLSGNLNTALFGDGEVVVLEIDPASLDPDLAYPDDLLMFILDEEFLSGCDRPEDLDAGIIDSFAARFSLERGKAERILTAALEAPDESAYPGILKEMWPEYLEAEGELAYLGDIPAAAIIGWCEYKHPYSGPQP